MTSYSALYDGRCKNYSRFRPRVSGSCVVISAASKYAAAHKQNAQPNPLDCPTPPITSGATELMARAPL
jgi:hypothetical protein